MLNDRPISEIAEIIFNMDDSRVQRAAELKAQGILELTKVEVRKRIQDRKFELELNQIEQGDVLFDHPVMDKKYFTLYRD